jgi:hypothetical protein
MEVQKLNNKVVPKTKTSKRARTLVLYCLLTLLIIATISGCGHNNQIVGEWHMTKVLIGEQEYDAATFLDPTKQTDGTFFIQIYGDNTLIATGSLGTIKGASDGEWKKIKENKFSLTIDNQEREVEVVEDLLFMDIQIEDATLVIIFERQ